jgi:hypothetical protein
MFTGFTDNFDLKRLPIVARHQAAGSSTRNLLHWMQAIRYGRFRAFDHGPKKNVQLYGTEEPLEYDTSVLKKTLSGIPI